MSLSFGLKDIGREALNRAIQETPALTLRWYSFGLLLQKQTEHGLTEYAVSPEEVATALSKTVVFDSGVLKPNTICVRSEGVKRTVVEYRPRQKTPLWLEGAENTLHVPLPGLVLIRATTANRHPEYQVYAVAERPESYDAPLYHAPLPNVFSSGAICWGTVTRVSADQLRDNDLSGDWSQLLATPFGSHSVNGKCKSHPDDIRKLYLELEQRRSRIYPKKELVAVRKTLGSVLGVGV